MAVTRMMEITRHRGRSLGDTIYIDIIEQRQVSVKMGDTIYIDINEKRQVSVKKGDTI